MIESSIKKKGKKAIFEESILDSRAKELYSEINFDLMHRQVERVPGKVLVESASKGKENEKGNTFERKVSSEN